MSYKDRQKLKATPRILATSAELKAYQKKHNTSALRIAKLARAKLEGQAT